MSINLINYALAKKDWKKFYQDLEVLGVGGRNLLRNSKGPFILEPRNTGQPSDNYNFYRFYCDMELNETYTISADIEITHGDFNRITVVPYPDGEIGGTPIPPNGRIKHTFVKTSENINSVLIYAGPMGSTRGNGIIIRNVKIEKGNKATDWTPAPEDINAHPFVAELAETVFRSKQQDWEKAYEDLKVLGVGGRNLLPTVFDLYNLDGLYGYIKISDSQTMVKIYDKDVNVDISGVFVGMTGTGRDSSGGYKWIVREGTIDANYYLGVSNNYPYFSFYPKTKETFDKIFKRFYIKIEKGNKATDWTPAPEDIGAHPFVVELAETVFRSKQNEERIRNLENAITALGLEEKSISN